MTINFKIIYCRKAELPILCASYGCFLYQYHNVQYLNLKSRNKSEIIKCDFAHLINKKSVSEELNYIKNCTATLAHHFESCGYLQCVLVSIWSKFYNCVVFS
jgi:hypothetical protein